MPLRPGETSGANTSAISFNARRWADRPITSPSLQGVGYFTAFERREYGDGKEWGAGEQNGSHRRLVWREVRDTAHAEE